MNDPILPDDSQAASTEPSKTVSEDRMDRLEQAMGQLSEVVRAAAERVSTIQPMSAPQAPPRETPPEEFLNELAQNPQAVIERVARATFERTADATLTPAVLQVLDTASRQLLNERQLAIDTQFGIGAFDEFFRPQLDKDLAQLRQSNPRAIADSATLDALVHRLYGGDNFEKLMDRRKTLETAAARGHAHHMIPAAGIPRSRMPSENDIPNDVEQFLRDVEKSTGESIDRKRYAKLYYTGVESGPGRHRTSVLDYLKATGASPDTLKTYGGGGSA